MTCSSGPVFMFIVIVGHEAEVEEVQGLRALDGQRSVPMGLRPSKPLML